MDFDQSAQTRIELFTRDIEDLIPWCENEIQTDFRAVSPETETATDNFFGAWWLTGTDFGAPCKTTRCQRGIALDIASGDVCGDTKTLGYRPRSIGLEYFVGAKRAFAQIVHYLRARRPARHYDCGKKTAARPDRQET